MAIDYDLILDEFIDIARQALPTELSMIGPSNNLPAVIRARQPGPKPDHAYVTIDVLDTQDVNGWIKERYLDESNQMVYETSKYLLLNYRVYGGNAINIANKLHGYFRFQNTLDQIRENTGGALAQTFEVTQLPVLLADKYIESASFNFRFDIVDRFVETGGSDYFDNTHITGELFRDEDDPSPLSIDVIAP